MDIHADLIATEHYAWATSAGVRQRVIDSPLVGPGYVGISKAFRSPVKKRGWRRLNLKELIYNRLFQAIRGIGERANSLLKTTFKALRHVSLDPWRIGDISRAALAILHIEHNKPLPGTTTLPGKAHSRQDRDDKTGHL